MPYLNFYLSVENIERRDFDRFYWETGALTLIKLCLFGLYMREKHFGHLTAAKTFLKIMATVKTVIICGFSRVFLDICMEMVN